MRAKAAGSREGRLTVSDLKVFVVQNDKLIATSLTYGVALLSTKGPHSPKPCTFVGTVESGSSHSTSLSDHPSARKHRVGKIPYRAFRVTHMDG